MGARAMKFTKMHGLGNNYIYVNLFEETLNHEELTDLAVRVSNVNTGIGSDGMILIGPSPRADFSMRIFNNDGSEAGNCGNGLRCVAKYVFDRGLTQKREFTIDTKGGGVVSATVSLNDATGQVALVTIDMGEPGLCKKDLPMHGDADSITVLEPFTAAGHELKLTAVSTGNPHAVFFVEDVEQVPVAEIGPVIEHDPRFPERVNVEFNQVVSPTEMIFRVWERGSGITQACGTGACASVVAGVLTGHLTRGVPVRVHLLGGDLQIEWAKNGRIYMTGPAEFICAGEFYR
ncbi:MAG: diaminopimelate epimerase [Bacilli bacterium]|nr:diaminopimelate epimerase [Bacilli bacterium]